MTLQANLIPSLSSLSLRAYFNTVDEENAPQRPTSHGNEENWGEFVRYTRARQVFDATRQFRFESSVKDRPEYPLIENIAYGILNQIAAISPERAARIATDRETLSDAVIVRRLYEEFPRHNPVSSIRETEIENETRMGNFDRVHALLADGSVLPTTLRKCLEKAILRGHYPFVQSVLQETPLSANDRDLIGWTAICEGRLDIIQILSFKAPLPQKAVFDDWFKTAAGYNRLSIVEFLLQNTPISDSAKREILDQARSERYNNPDLAALLENHGPIPQRI